MTECAIDWHSGGFGQIAVSNEEQNATLRAVTRLAEEMALDRKHSVRSWLIVLSVITAAVLVAVLVRNSQESAGIRAEAATQYQQLMLDDLQSRQRIQELKIGSFQRDLWKGKWPDVDEELLTKLQEMTDERFEQESADP